MGTLFKNYLAKEAKLPEEAIATSIGMALIKMDKDSKNLAGMLLQVEGDISFLRKGIKDSIEQSLETIEKEKTSPEGKEAQKTIDFFQEIIIGTVQGVKEFSKKYDEEPSNREYIKNVIKEFDKQGEELVETFKKLYDND